MAARRLVIVMIVLLAISTLAAALLPPPDRDSTTTQPQRLPPAVGSPSAPKPGLLLEAGMRVGAPPKTVRIERGDRLQLAVSVESGHDVEIPGFGLTEPATPFAPARFDLVATQPGTYPVRAVGSERAAGRVLVGRRANGRCGVTRPEARRAPGSARACSRPGTPARAGRGRSAQRP